MKKSLLQFTALAVLYITTTSSSCNNNSTSPTNTLGGTVNGTTWIANNVTVMDSTVSGVRQLIMHGQNVGSNQIISVAIVRYTGVTGTYPVHLSDSNTYAVTDYFTGGNTHIGDTGQVVITAATTHSAQGTFYFKTQDSITVANGHFDVHY